ncbi:hypothetical protein XELAEV_18013112mg [Xenopus laevis]|uniref:C3H1-type domain-containing protein n=1 Tax=Xenopus laevis TaxID=8355 RepID=A0A974DNW1_XENLA|nr:hypothetical protein XELAEV_18013112mg [Xenopus laevis]
MSLSRPASSADPASPRQSSAMDKAARLEEILRWAQFEAGADDLRLLSQACLRPSSQRIATGTESPPSEEATSPLPPTTQSRGPAKPSPLKRYSTRSFKGPAKKKNPVPNPPAKKKVPQSGGHSRSSSAPTGWPPAPTSAAQGRAAPPTGGVSPAEPSTSRSTAQPHISAQPHIQTCDPPLLNTAPTTAGPAIQPLPDWLPSTPFPSQARVAPPTVDFNSRAPASSQVTASPATAWPSMSPPASQGLLAPPFRGGDSLNTQSCNTLINPASSQGGVGSFRAVATATAPVSSPTQSVLALQVQPPLREPAASLHEINTAQDIGNTDNAQLLKSLLRLLVPGAASTQPSAGAPESAFRDSILCETTPLGLHLSQSIKDKINRGEYVDLLSLLPSVKVFLKDKKSEAEEDRRRPVARTFTNWLQAFCIYANILCSGHPQLGASLFKHVDIILEAYKSYGGISWFVYEDRFRQKMAVQTSIPWGTKDVDLWMGMMAPRPVTNPPILQKPGQKYNTCWAYNDSACKWQGNCKFKHECSHCGSNHPAFRCVKKFITTPNKLLSKEAGKFDNSGEVNKYASLPKAVPKPQDGGFN